MHIYIEKDNLIFRHRNPKKKKHAHTHAHAHKQILIETVKPALRHHHYYELDDETCGISVTKSPNRSLYSSYAHSDKGSKYLGDDLQQVRL